MSWERARKPEQKADRVEQILMGAAELFDAGEFSDISMRGLAEKSQMGKASLYQYFETKEEVFASLYCRELELWLTSVEQRLARMRKLTPARLAHTLATILKEHPRFCRLTVLFSSVLERNLSDHAIVTFKSSLVEPMNRFVQVLTSVYPGFSKNDAAEFLFQHHAVIAGLWPLAHPSPQVDAVLDYKEFQHFRVDFFPLIERTLQRLLV